MFNYPILPNSNTLYSKIGITPDAKSDDITNAKGEIVRELTVKKREIDKRLALINEKYPELNIQKTKLKELVSKGNTQKVGDYQTLLSTIAELERKAQEIDPEYKKLDNELEKVERKINEMNILKLENESERKKYDALTPPCALLKIDSNISEIITKNQTRLHFVRKGMSDFFEHDLDMVCYYPSDFKRKIFIGDFEYNQLIDEENP